MQGRVAGAQAGSLWLQRGFVSGALVQSVLELAAIEPDLQMVCCVLLGKTPNGFILLAQMESPLWENRLTGATSLPALVYQAGLHRDPLSRYSRACNNS